MSTVSHCIDSELGRWTHTEWRPGPGHPLESSVDRVWDFDGMAAAPQERVFPNGLIELILQVDDRYVDVREQGLVPTPAACVTGIHSRSFAVRAPRRPCRVLGVRLHPEGAWRVLSHPLCELADLTADLDDLLPPAVRDLAERCHDAGSGIDRVRRAVEWLSRRLHDRSAAPPAAAAHWVARRIVLSGGGCPIGPLRAQAGLSDARLVALFRQQVGVTPKRYARIHRFDRALSLLSRGGSSLSRVAQAAGYYDQPHMNAEFRRIAGFSPRRLVAARRFPHSLSLPEAG
jgi:AraC-like DNA-binding protein